MFHHFYKEIEDIHLYLDFSKVSRIKFVGDIISVLSGPSFLLSRNLFAFYSKKHITAIAVIIIIIVITIITIYIIDNFIFSSSSSQTLLSYLNHSPVLPILFCRSTYNYQQYLYIYQHSCMEWWNTRWHLNKKNMNKKFPSIELTKLSY